MGGIHFSTDVLAAVLLSPSHYDAGLFHEGPFGAGVFGDIFFRHYNLYLLF